MKNILRPTEEVVKRRTRGVIKLHPLKDISNE
nr:MAG TPA: hypothetical protein [Caudoviricetes sp.]